MCADRVRALAGLALAAALAMPAAHAVAGNGYDFQYRFGGERAILPLQVFDDGERTYFQWRSTNGVVPAILADTDAGPRAVPFERNGPYIVVQGVARGFRLQFGSLVGTVEYQGSRAAAPAAIGLSAAAAMPVSVASPPQQASLGAPAAGPGTSQAGGVVEPVVAQGVYGERKDVAAAATSPREVIEAAPAARLIPFAPGQATLDREGQRALQQAFEGRGAILSVTIVGRDDPVMVDGLARKRAMALRAAALRAGAPANAITVREGLVREGDRANASDITIVRASPASRSAGVAGEPQTVAEAMGLIQRGLSGLVRMGRISAEWADGMLAALRRLVDGVDKMSSVAKPTANVALDRTASEPMTKVVATLYGETSTATALWVMLPADGTAQQGLRKWAHTAGVELVWEADVDYPVTKPIFHRGTARSAIETLRAALEAAPTPLTIEYHANKLVVRNLQLKGMTA